MAKSKKRSKRSKDKMKNSKLMLILLLIWCTITDIVGMVLLIVRKSVVQDIIIRNFIDSSYENIIIISSDIISLILFSGLIIFVNIKFLMAFKNCLQELSNDNSRYDEILNNVICRTDFSNDADMQITITSDNKGKVDLKIAKNATPKQSDK